MMSYPSLPQCEIKDHSYARLLVYLRERTIFGHGITKVHGYTCQRVIQAFFTAKQDASQARQEHQLRFVVTALVLFSWQLHIPDIAAHKRVNLWYELSEAYRYLPTRDYQTSQQIAKSSLYQYSNVRIFIGKWPSHSWH